MLSTKWAHKFWLSTVVIWADRKYGIGKNGWKYKEFRYRELQLKIHIKQVVFLYPPTGPMNPAPLVIPKFNLLGVSCSLLGERSRNDQERTIRSTNVIILEQVEVEAPAEKIAQLYIFFCSYIPKLQEKSYFRIKKWGNKPAPAIF